MILDVILVELVALLVTLVISTRTHSDQLQLILPDSMLKFADVRINVSCSSTNCKTDRNWTWDTQQQTDPLAQSTASVQQLYVDIMCTALMGL